MSDQFCTVSGKVIYASPQKAMQHVRQPWRVRPYQCTHCNQYHLSSSQDIPNKKRQAMDTRRYT